VLDSNVFINNLSYLFNDVLVVTTPFIEEELKSLPSKMDFYRASSMNLHIMLPKREYFEKVKKLSDKTKHKLTNADISIIALSLEFKEKNKNVVLVSDDYSVQDLASRLSIDVLSLTKPKIKEHYEWKRICIACNRETSSDICEICGLRTVYIRKRNE